MNDWQRRITINPDQCGGRPCIRGLRIRIIDILDLMAAGLSSDEIIEELPDLEKEDILAVKYLLHSLKVNIPIISKIEKPQAVDNLDEILSVTDMIMVARGDMGVEVGNHLVPSIQKKIISF